MEAGSKSANGRPRSPTTLPNVCNAGTWDGRMWTSIYRYFGVSTVGKVYKTSSPREMLKTFWNSLSPLKDERRLKGIWFRMKNEFLAAEFSRGINTPTKTNLDKKTPMKNDQSKKPQKEKASKAPGPATSGGAKREDFSEQAIYILDYPPKKISGITESPKKAEGKVKTLESSSPVTRSRLSCPLPPSEFLPPERTLYIPNFQPPNVRYAILQSAFLPGDNSSGQKPRGGGGGGGGGGKKATENKPEKPSPTLEPKKDNPLEKKQTMKASESKTEQKAPRGSGQVMGKEKPKEQKEQISVPPAPLAPLVDSLDIPEFMPDTRKRKNILSLTNAKSQHYSEVEASETPHMNALLFNPKELKLQFTAVEAPTNIHKDEVLVKISYSGVTNFDLLMLEGVIPCEEDSVIPGHEVSGVVYAVGSDVDHVEPGDKIVINAYSGCSACKNCAKGLFASCLNGGINNSLGVSKNGGWAEFIVAKKAEVYKVPEELGLEKAVLVMLLSCILSAQKKLNLSYDSNVIIQGLGMSGMLWASLLHSRGFKNVLVSDKNEKKKSQFDSLNLKYAFLQADDIRKESADVVVECMGTSSSIEKSLNILNPNGQICLFGNSSPASQIRCSPFQIAQREITIVGSEGNNLCFSEAIDLAAILSSTYLNLEKLGVKEFELNDYQRAFRMEKYGQVGKVIFKLET